MPRLTSARLKQVLRYDPATGEFAWLDRPEAEFKTRQGYLAWRRTCWGKEPGTVRRDGYRRICIDCDNHWAHRLAWLYTHGDWPKGAIDHINGNPADNRIENLRDIPRGENQKNMSLSKANNSGVVGVQFSRKYGTWKAVISHLGRNIHLGSFATKTEAVDARQRAEQRYGFHPNHGRAGPLSNASAGADLPGVSASNRAGAMAW